MAACVKAQGIQGSASSDAGGYAAIIDIHEQSFTGGL